MLVPQPLIILLLLLLRFPAAEGYYMPSNGQLGLIFALAGLSCGVGAAALHGGWVESLGAASAGLTTLGGIFGINAKIGAKS